jgi:hypothetical protein
MTGVFVAYVKNPLLFQSSQAVYRLGYQKMQEGRHLDMVFVDELKEAVALFQLAVEKGYTKREVFDNLTLCYSILGDDKNKRLILTQALKHYPTDVEFQRELKRIEE